MKKVLVLGATGMAGHVAYQYLSELDRYEMYSVCFRNKFTNNSIIADIRDEKAISAIITSIMPDIVVNCIGILIKGSKASLENCIFINAYFPHMIQRILHESVPSSKLIHISTDCVFSGGKGNYKDSDIKDALDVYGMTKNLGEIITDKDLTIRTSIIGPELKPDGEGLFHWVFQKRKVGVLEGYTRNIWGGVTTLELAKVVEAAIENNITGLYQVSNNQRISKYELVSDIVKEFKLPIKVNPVDGVISDRSIINSEGISYKYLVSGYKEMLSEIHEFMSLHRVLYTQYLENV